GEVLDLGGDGELAAGLIAFEDQGREIGAGGIQRGRQASRARAEDDHTVVILQRRWRGVHRLRRLRLLLGDGHSRDLPSTDADEVSQRSAAGRREGPVYPRGGG